MKLEFWQYEARILVMATACTVNTILHSTALALASYFLYRRKSVTISRSKRSKSSSILRVRKPTRHKVLRADQDGINSKWLSELFPKLVKDFLPQGSVKYKGVDWKISCYMELEDSFISGSFKVEPAIKLLETCRPLLDKCDELFGNWYRHCYGLKRAKPYRVHSFLTRYLPLNDQDQLKKHIDGKHLDGSVVVRLPSQCVGGQLKVWDGRPVQEFEYKMDSGDVVLLDKAVWHQAVPVTEGIKWALVIFYKVDRKGLTQSRS